MSDSERDAWAERYSEQPQKTPKKRPHKYNAKRTEIDGKVFDSKGEAFRYQELKLEEIGGEVSDVKRQVRFPLVVNEILVCTFVADFTYTRKGETAITVEDFKGVMTPVARLKHRLFVALHPELRLLVTHGDRRRGSNRR